MLHVQRRPDPPAGFVDDEMEPPPDQEPSPHSSLGAFLASDQGAEMRASFGRQLADLLPSLAGEAHRRLRDQAVAALMALVADEAERVRRSVAEAVKHMSDAPREIILRLAHDPVVMVSEPVIRFSPVLTQRDLVGLVVAAPSPATIVAVARRPGIDASVSDAVVAAAHHEAITALLANPSAQIQEATLDALILRTREEVAWREPLVCRPHLSPHAIRTLSDIVTKHLLEVLAARNDLDPSVSRELSERLHDLKAASANHPPPGNPNSPLARAAALREAGRLDETAFAAAARQGDSELLAAMLAVKADVAPEVVERATVLRSGKGIVALAWKASLSMRIAILLQSVMGRLPPDVIIHARPGGAYPMTVSEMRWQLEFMYRTGR